jgi:hypothetical protein
MVGLQLAVEDFNWNDTTATRNRVLAEVERVKGFVAVQFQYGWKVNFGIFDASPAEPLSGGDYQKPLELSVDGGRIPLVVCDLDDPPLIPGYRKPDWYTGPPKKSLQKVPVQRRRSTAQFELNPRLAKKGWLVQETG